ncbi:hypothetical protein ACFYNO_33190 [Kitasatospora sp. NPDC006697]|uniref:hypothetical protein n=1 Tax=Kitasatospora sp. NPDC006697 TaxID=3364020 RepID=UPI0036A23A78
MSHQGVQVLEAVVAARVVGRDAARVLRRLLGAGVRIGLADLLAAARRAGASGRIGEGE